MAAKKSRKSNRHRHKGVTLHLPPDVLARLDALAREAGRTRVAQVCKLVQDASGNVVHGTADAVNDMHHP